MDYIINGAGAKIYHDIEKHELLEIPSVNIDSEVGKVYEVLSVGIVNDKAIATIKEGHKVTAYQLPNGLIEWVLHSLNYAKEGYKPFPSKVNFIEFNGRYFADIY